MPTSNVLNATMLHLEEITKAAWATTVVGVYRGCTIPLALRSNLPPRMRERRQINRYFSTIELSDNAAGGTIHDVDGSRHRRNEAC